MMFADLCWITVCKTCRVLAVYFVKGVHQCSPDIPEKCVCVIMYSTALVDMLQRKGQESFVCPGSRMH
jgi:hypothetical protein